MSQLSAGARQVFSEAQAGGAILIVSHIVLAELYFVLDKQRRPDLFDIFVARLRATPAFRVEAVVLDDVLDLKNFTEIPEMHDRLIAVQAKQLGAKILTKDAHIRASTKVQCVW